tara:strand:+ start:349 stop:603 length:255 start_codon:yes stop_codon:yes gene_type:complete
MKRLLLPLITFFKKFNQDYLDDESYLENVDLDAGKANPPEEMVTRKLFVDFADYDHFPTTEDIEKLKSEKQILNCVLPSKEYLE